ncbi:MAG: nucleotide exchange factor GrpE [Spirochaetota bacterium]
MSNKHHERRDSATPKASDSIPAEKDAPEASSSPATDDPGSTGEGEVGELNSQRDLIKVLEARVLTLADESSSLKDQYLRSLAEYENFRKRMFREREDLQKYANFAILGDLVSLLDDFDRAIASAENARDYQTLHDGIVLIRRQIGSVLENKYGLTRFESIGKPFDPHVHEAVASEPGDSEEPVVSLEFLPGYKLHERVVRSAKVRVKMPVPEPRASVSATAPVIDPDPALANAGE